MKRNNSSDAGEQRSSPGNSILQPPPYEHLVIGSRVHCILHDGTDGIVFAIHGQQQPETIKEQSTLGMSMISGGNADFEIVFSGHIPHTSKVSESTVRTVQWRILPGIAGNNEITAALANAEAAKRSKLQQAEEDKDTLRRRGESFRKTFSFLNQLEPGEHAPVKFAATNMRKELANRFPGVKFSVRSETFCSGKSSIEVVWTSGPTVTEVKSITNKYEMGCFNGRQDIYEYHKDDAWIPIFGGAEYIRLSRPRV